MSSKFGIRIRYKLISYSGSINLDPIAVFPRVYVTLSIMVYKLVISPPMPSTIEEPDKILRRRTETVDVGFMKQEE
jgi:hypothetical protein